jgi:hypothetical protein
VGRWIACPGSVAAERKAPKPPSSEFAELGTAVHAMFARCLRQKLPAEAVTVNATVLPALALALDLTRQILESRPFMVELRLPPLSGLSKVWGTSDVLAFASTGPLEIVLDLKFGEALCVEPYEIQLGIYTLLAARRFGAAVAGIDVWVPAQFVTRATAFPPFFEWRDRNFFPLDQYKRHWQPHAGVETAITATLRSFTQVVDQAALTIRPPVIEIVHDVPLDAKSASVYQVLDGDGTTDAVAAQIARGLMPASEMAIVMKLMQVCSGASYEDDGGWTGLHDRRLDMLQEIHEEHDRPTLLFIGFHHELERIQQRFSNAVELTAARIDAWNLGEIEMLVAHPASGGHGVNLQHDSDTLVWFSLPWSAELYAQVTARLARQGQRGTVNIHIMLSRGRIDEIAHRVVHQRIADQDRLIAALT